MKKVFKIEGLDCANCAMEVERAISKIEGVGSASVNFMAQKIVLELNEDALGGVTEKMLKVVKKIEPDCKIKI